MEETSNHIHMINLNESDWMIWKLKMEDLPYCKDLFAPVEGDSAKLKATIEEDWKGLIGRQCDTFDSRSTTAFSTMCPPRHLHILFGRNWKISMRRRRQGTRHS